mgnify:CR=1 FL=1
MCHKLSTPTRLTQKLVFRRVKKILGDAFKSGTTSNIGRSAFNVRDAFFKRPGTLAAATLFFKRPGAPRRFIFNVRDAKASFSYGNGPFPDVKKKASSGPIGWQDGFFLMSGPDV